MPRYIILIKADPMAETTEFTPGPAVTEMFAKMLAFNEELNAAGVLLSGDGLRPSAIDGRRLVFGPRGGADASVTNGPFDLSKQDTICGWWILRTKDVDEAVAWAKKIPFPEGASVDVRRISETDEFSDVMTPEMLAREKKLAEDTKKRAAESA